MFSKDHSIDSLKDRREHHKRNKSRAAHMSEADHATADGAMTMDSGRRDLLLKQPDIRPPAS